MPEFYRTTLTQELIEMAKAHELSVEDVDELVLNGVRASFLAAENKEAMIGDFQTQFAALKEKHLS